MTSPAEYPPQEITWIPYTALPSELDETEGDWAISMGTQGIAAVRPVLFSGYTLPSLATADYCAYPEKVL